MSNSRRFTRLAAAAAAAAVLLPIPGAALARHHDAGARHHDGAHASRPTIYGHRGAAGYRPEHTLASYRVGARVGADYIEPDLVSTKDHVLVARHENEISGTTDVAAHPEFADRRATKTVDGRPVTGWFTEDFTLSELKTLRAKERVPDLRPDNTAFDGLPEIPTFEEVVRLALAHGVGVYPETKHPTYFDSIGLSLEEPLLDVLNRNHVRKAYIQSFETANLRELRAKTRLPLIQLITFGGAPYDWIASGNTRTYDDMVTPEGLREVAGYANGIGVDTRRVVPVDATGATAQPTTLIADAHRKRLDVHVWTVRNENSQLPADYRVGNPASPVYPRATGDVAGWLSRLIELGIDGAFCDDPAMGRAVVATQSA
jgi:glycerophosphoryl diester phosphodiesterase